MSDYRKDPQATLPYTINWATESTNLNDGSSDDTGWLQGDTIATSTWSVSGPDALLVIEADSNTTTNTTIRLSGGTVGKRYIVTNQVTTASSPVLIDERSIEIEVMQR